MKDADQEILYGTLSDVLRTGANDVYIVKRAGLKDLLFPATDKTVLKTDIENGYVDVIIPEGLDDI